MDKDDITQIRDEIILAALSHVAFDGWNWAVIEKSAEQAGHSEPLARAVFPEKMMDVLDGFADLGDRKMLEALDGVNPEELRVRDRIKTALMKRYEFLLPHKEAVRQSAQFWIVPTRKPRAAKIVWRTADRIWNFAGDDAKDYNYYTKRVLLSGIITSSMLAWLSDKEEGLDNVEGFVDRRIGNVMQFGKFISNFKKAV